ncbi:MAG: ion channel [Leadbetterella sp.]
MKKSNLVDLEKQRQDTGFGTSANSSETRLVRPDGNFNVRKIGQSFEAHLDIFHRLMTIPWWKLTTVVVSFYFVTNLLFAGIYVAIGIEYLQGIVHTDGIHDFWEAFFFSSQTLTTLGYGRIAPVGFMTNIVSSLEALLGLLAFSLTTGILYGRFSRPSPKILYSDNALIAPYLDTRGLMIRIVNEKSSQLINVNVTLIFSKNEIKNGEKKRQYHTLELERAYVKYFSLSWTIVHPITANSPLYKETPESLRESNAELLLSIDGSTETHGDSVHSRKSYLHSEIKWGRKFVSIISEDGHEYTLDLANNDRSEPAELPELE